MKRQVITTSEVKAKLAKIFRVTPRCVYDALHFTSPANKLHRKIRIAAIESGGIDSKTVPTCECWHDANGLMTLDMDNGARIIADKNTGLARLIGRKGNELARIEKAHVSELHALQETAKNLY